MNTRRRSLLKSITWRLTAVGVLGVVSYLITGSWREAEIITAIYTAIQIGVFYAHERLWERIDWGKG